MSFFGDLFSVFGAGDQKKAVQTASQAQITAQQQAAAAQVAAQQQGIDKIGAQQAQTQQSFQPYLDTGSHALGGEADLLGLNGNEASASAINALQTSPLFQSLYNTGQNTILQNASATGGLRGGNIQNSLANFGSSTLAQVIRQQLANLGGLSGQGLSAANSLGSFGAQSSNSIASLFNQQGAAQSTSLANQGRLQSGSILDQAKIGQQQLASLGDLFGGATNFFAPGLGSSLSSAFGGGAQTASGSPPLDLDALLSSLPF